MTLREQAAADAKAILEDKENGLGTDFILTSLKEKKDFPMVGSYGDIAYLFDPTTGQAVQGRTIEAAYSMASLLQLTAEEPERGWGFKTVNLNGKEIRLFVTAYQPDYTLGVARIQLGVKI